jgi:methionyl-tRNA formyltransferase
MKLYIVIDETRFYHPDFIADFIRNTKDEIVGATLVTHILPKNNIETYLLKHWYYLKISEMFKLAFQKILYIIKDNFILKNREGKFYSVRSVFNFFEIDFQIVKYNINQEKYIEHIRSKNPDVLISSNSLVFNQEILNIPKICSINRHSALLPSYGGLWPVFQAFRSGEKEIGVSIHTMERKIDKGKVLSQQSITIEKNNTIADLYEKCFSASSKTLIEALDKIRRNDLTSISINNNESYFSFPTSEHWKQFRKLKGKFI